MASFFERVLPAEGPFTLFTGVSGPDGKLIKDQSRHWNGLKTHADVEREVQRLSMLPVNVFFAVGSYAGANRKDPVAKRAIWLDLDGKDFEGGTEQAMRELGRFLKATGLPRPSIYVGSGRGVHVYWCLDRDVPVAEWKHVATALKTKCEELGFNADLGSTADPARVLRAPGSLNRKGEVPIPCNVLTDTGLTYALDDIAKQLQVAPKLSGAVAKLAALASNDDLVTRQHLEKKTAAEVREMLGFINLPEVNSREKWTTVLCSVQDWGDKSQESFDIFHEWSRDQPKYESEEDCWVTWQSFDPGGGYTIGTLIKLAREAGWGEPPAPQVVTPADGSFVGQMASVTASPIVTAQAGSGEIADTQTAAANAGYQSSPLEIAASYLIQQLGKPRFSRNEAVGWLSNEFVLIKDQDGLYFSLTERQTMSKTSIDDMLTRWMPFNDNGVPTNASLLLRRYGTSWTVDSQGFYPGMGRIYQEDGRMFVNLYNDPPEMLVPTVNEARLVCDLWDYLFPRQEDKIFGNYLLCFYAHVVQKPHIKITSAPLMVSREFGTGKTTAMYDIPAALVGQKNARKVSNKVLRSAFTDYLTGTQFLHFDEVHINGKWDSDDTANSLKDMVTGSTVEVHPKGLKPYNIPNRIFITATSNYEDAITLPSNDERRWGVYYLEPTRGYSKSQREAYFKVIHDWLDSSRGPGVLRYIFSRVDISAFNPHAPPPITASKLKMIEKSQANEIQILIDAHREQTGPFSREIFTNESVGQFLHSETGRTYDSLSVRGFIQRAVRESKIVRDVRLSSGNKMRVWAHVNHQHWISATAEEVRDALKT